MVNFYYSFIIIIIIKLIIFSLLISEIGTLVHVHLMILLWVNFLICNTNFHLNNGEKNDMEGCISIFIFRCNILQCVTTLKILFIFTFQSVSNIHAHGVIGVW